jgi:hypothetical protein
MTKERDISIVGNIITFGDEKVDQETMHGSAVYTGFVGQAPNWVAA